MSAGKDAAPTEYQRIAEELASSNTHKAQEDSVEAANKLRQRQFKASHAIIIIFFLWIFCLHALGIYFFTKGFLLTRLVLDFKSECAVSPLELPHQRPESSTNGCWHPKTFDRAVVVIVDALRYDFTVPFDDRPHHFHNALRVLHETAIEQPYNAFLLPFIADPPTTTLQRLKGLTTGTLPTFIDAGSNFAGTAIEEDNLVAQLRDAGKNLVHLGDDTWHSLFPGYFDANLTHAYDSFNVWDLHTVDNGVTEHLLPLLDSSNTSRWDVIFGHYLGVDHAGHRYGPDHPAMAAKLKEMDGVFRQIISVLDEETLLVVMGDHGMD
ncbi:mannose-ethanolamine phosphotransferase gpi13, partial [Hypocenomyce scalaris]|nr:mannose-ethanolamine phosphotransferase gpi13 [Hypocenomyce scalaris]